MIPTTIDQLLHARSGRMTDELVLRPTAPGMPSLPERLSPATTTKMVCGFCSTGCRLIVHHDASGQAINASPDPDYPVNLGMACPKGWEALTVLQAPDRATTPLLRATSGGPLEPASWEQAMAAFVSNFKAIQAHHGAESIAVLSTGQTTTEEMALLGAVAKFGMGVRHLDSNTRQCMATAHTAYKQSFGFDAPPYTYRDFEESDVLVLVGSNLCIAHPILWQRVMRNPHRPEIIVVDPRRTETAMLATQHIALRPRSDLTLFYGLAREMIIRGKIDRAFVDAHTTGYDAFAEFVAAFTPEHVCEQAGLTPEAFEKLASTIADGKRVSFWWTMGVNQGYEATRTAQAIINLALMTGNIGRPGTGPNSITGQCNAMGARLFGNATSLLGGYDFADPQHRAHVAGILGIDAACIPDGPSKAYDQILDAIDAGEIRGLWIVATNTAHSWIGHRRFEELRRKLDFLVVQDMYASTETACMADLVLPAAGWGEKEGTLINSERRISPLHRVSRAPGQALSDFSIFRLIASAWGCSDMFARWSSPAAAFQILKELSRGRPCDFSGIHDHAHLAEAGGIQWPWPSAASESVEPACERRLFADGRFFTKDERARFLFDPPRPPPEAPDAEFPFWLNTGRGSSAQWHTGTRTAKSAVLGKLAPRSVYVEIHPDDAARLRIADGTNVCIVSRRSTVEAAAFVTPTVQPGQLFMPMHFPTVNRLTFPAFDPHSRQPNYKACAVRVEPTRR